MWGILIWAMISFALKNHVPPELEVVIFFFSPGLWIYMDKHTFRTVFLCPQHRMTRASSQ